MRSFTSFSLKRFTRTTAPLQFRFYSEKKSDKQMSVAVVMTGCGYLDGTDVTEAVTTLVKLQRFGYETIVVTPAGESDLVVNHLTREADVNEMRTIANEVSRINRGRVAPLRAVSSDRFDAVVFPGGWGAANVLADFQESGSGTEFAVKEEVVKIIQDFHKAKKPMAFSNVASLLPAKVLGTNNGGPGLALTLGPENDPNGEIINKLGNTFTPAGFSDVVIDRDNWIVSTPGFQGKGSNFATTYDGVSSLLDKLKWLMDGGVEESSFGEEAYDPELERAMIEEMGEEEWKLQKKLNYIKLHSPMSYSKFVKWEDQELKKFKKSHITDDLGLAQLGKEKRDSYQKEVVEPLEREFNRRRETVISKFYSEAQVKAKKRQEQEEIRKKKFGELLGFK